MARILITTIGSGGDVHPFVAVALELAKRGHEVEMLVNPHYRERIEAAGLRVRPLGTAQDLLDVLHHPHLAKPWLSPLLIIRELIGRTVGPTLEGVEASLREFRPDVIVRHHISLGTRWAAERAGVPCVACVLAPIFWFNPRDGAVQSRWQLERPPMWLARLRLTLGRLAMRVLFDRPLNRLRRERGLAPECDQFRREVEDAHAVLGLWSPGVRPPMEGDPPRSVVCGFCEFDRSPGQEARLEELRSFLDSCEAGDRAPVVFTLGTSVVHHHGDFYDHAAAAMERLGRPAVLLTGTDDYAPKGLPANVRAFPYAPYTMLFPRAAAIVHHGGAGTTAAALRSGRPTVIVPFANDEFDNARRAKLLGCSRTLHAGDVSGASLEAALRLVLEDRAMAGRAAAIGGVMRAEHGPARAADEIERVIEATKARRA